MPGFDQKGRQREHRVAALEHHKRLSEAGFDLIELRLGQLDDALRQLTDRVTSIAQRLEHLEGHAVTKQITRRQS